VPALLRSSIRIIGSVGTDANGTGTKQLPLSTGALRELTRTDPACSASTVTVWRSHLPERRSVHG
jgi:hypothetical protein